MGDVALIGNYSERDQNQAAFAFGTGIRAAYERLATIPEVFAQRVLERSLAVAVVSAEGALTYAQVERNANRIANYLRSLGVVAGAAVGVGFERSIELPSVLLGILKAGAAYVPLDPAYPPARLAQMTEDAAVSIVLTDESRARFPEIGVRHIAVRDALAGNDERAPVAGTGPTSLAYITYTSGSTGRPKGVAIEQRGVLRLVRGADYCEIDVTDTFMHFAPLAFDASTFEIWAPLLNGARLAIPKAGMLSMDELADTIDRFAVTTMFLTTALFQRFVDEPNVQPSSLRHLMTGGEVASSSHMTRFLRMFPNCRLSAVYGPTENTTFSTWCDIPSSAAIGTSVPIGRPIANSTAYVLDGDLRLAPPGVIGELCVGGDGVARGYVNLPNPTSERFVPDPFSPDSSSRLYRTGDRACWRSDGLLEFHGRDDDQVKVRGFRIELGEIKSVLLTHEAVAEAAVVVDELAGHKEIVAHVAFSHGAGANERQLRAHLAAALPAYMIPHRIVLHDALPLGSNGKVDLAALDRHPAQTVRSTPPMPRLTREPASAGLERGIAELWREVLGRDQVPAPDENFFDAGGDSLRLLSIHARLRERLHVELSVSDLFEQSTIRKLAVFLERAQGRS